MNIKILLFKKINSTFKQKPFTSCLIEYKNYN